jgi:osmoprotectant transport system permease protein
LKKIVLHIIFFLLTTHVFAQQKITVGAKHFNEGYILSEIISQLLENEGFHVERKFNLGGTSIAFEALNNKQIDVYPEYSGTLSAEILKHPEKLSLDAIKAALGKKYGLEISKPFGFNNTYAIVMSDVLAEKNGISKISDLASHNNLSGAISYEFLERQDGWKNLATEYGITSKVKGIEHGLAYTALNSDKIDFTDAYSTDGEIKKYNLKVLEDDRHFFPDYSALGFYSSTLPVKAKQAIEKLNGQITENEMQEMNALSLYAQKSFAVIANDFLVKRGLKQNATANTPGYWEDLLKHLFRHLYLTFISVLIAVAIALPLGLFLYKSKLLAKPVLYLTGILQTIPSIALLALLIPLLGIGAKPAIVALCVYALLPVLRNTITGLESVDPQLKNVATAIGLNKKETLRLVELPLAMPTILSGIRIASVINVGTATLAAFIGAGGLGEYIVTGLALNNTELILKGAIPAAILAIVIELLFELITKLLTKKVKER